MLSNETVTAPGGKGEQQRLPAKWGTTSLRPQVTSAYAAFQGLRRTHSLHSLHRSLSTLARGFVCKSQTATSPPAALAAGGSHRCARRTAPAAQHSSGAPGPSCCARTPSRPGCPRQPGYRAPACPARRTTEWSIRVGRLIVQRCTRSDGAHASNAGTARCTATYAADTEQQVQGNQTTQPKVYARLVSAPAGDDPWTVHWVASGTRQRQP